MNIYDMQTNAMVNPLGIDIQKPSFSWKLHSDKYGIMQKSYRVVVAQNENMNEIVWDSGSVDSDKSINIKYEGNELKPSVRYYWYVEVENNNNEKRKSDIAWFETGLLGIDKSVWHDAKWIGGPKPAVNTDSLSHYNISMGIETDTKAGIVISARNKDNYVLIELDISNRLVNAYEYCDNAWTTGVKTVNKLGDTDGYKIPNHVPLNKENNIEIKVNGTVVTILINSETVTENINIIPLDPPNQPRKQYLMNFGIKQENCSATYSYIKIENSNNEVYQYDDFSDDSGILSALGTVINNKLIVDNEFNIVNPVPSVNVRKVFELQKTIKSARLYSSAKGFYNVYINGEQVNNDFYNPGFTDYRKRIHYQTYDVTDKLKQGQNNIGATVTKGYYTGYVGYSRPMTYGTRNSFIGQLIISYTDGTTDIIVTDETWQFTDKGAVICADYQQGENYDARLEINWNDLSDNRWNKCGVYEWTFDVIPTNGTLENEYFELSAQLGPTAKVERILKPIGEVVENPKGHFVYDFGQNMVGTISLKLKGERGKTIKLRYGEMCSKDGKVYLANLRTAANTDTYILKGDKDGETFIPYFSSHGFRYVEITGNGYELTKEDIERLVVEISGLVITNTTKIAGDFECSNEAVNKLQSNIQWGQRGNSLLVYTDCPQRNERMGWTGDGQVFAKTAAYNMDVKAFMNKWLEDIKDGQFLYNKNGAVPDTAPLGGDNRADGCAGWADAAVIIPWEMYQAYGDISVLQENYEVMKKWVDYQSRSDRQNYGVRIVDGIEVPEKSDLATAQFIQVQQRRGDHLTFDESTPFILSATAYAAKVSEILADTAKILGRVDDEIKYRKRYENIKQAFNEAWVQEDGSIAYWGEQSKSEKDINGSIINQTYYSDKDGSTATPSQTAYALAIDFGLIPKEKLKKAAECFKKSIDLRGGKLSVGFLGISHLAPALTKVGFIDTAFALLEQEENPSWLYSVQNGATTIWERWNSYISETDTFGNALMNSFNHYSYGAIGEWLFSDVLGINATEIGYKSIMLKPTFGGSLTYAKGYHDSPYGKITSEWNIIGDKFIYKCSIPANTTAILYLPANSENITDKNGENIDKINGVTYESRIGNRAVLRLVSGCYEFISDIS